MRTFMLLLVLVAGVAGFALWWYGYFVSPSELLNAEASVLRPLDPSERPRTPADDEGASDQQGFRQTSEMRVKAMDLNLVQLKVKAKNGRAVTKEKLNEAIEVLNGQTEDARNELRDFRMAPPQQWKARKARLNSSLEELERSFEKAFARFMNESAALRPRTPSGIADGKL